MTQRFDGRIGAFAYMLFILLYFPCVAALGAINREVGPRWAMFAALWTTGLAYFAAVSTYQAATFMRHPVSSSAWIGGLALGMVVVVAAMRHMGHKPAPAAQHPPQHTVTETTP